MKKKNDSAPLPWVGYTRVSTEEQAKSGLSMEEQAAKVRGMAAAKGIELAEVIEDAGYTAKNLDRPGAARLMEMIRNREISGIIIAKLDRLTRSLKDLLYLTEAVNKAHVTLVSTAESFDTSTASGQLVMNIIGAVSQWERAVICERTRDGLHALKARGEHAGQIPYGFRSSGLKKDGGTGKAIEDEAEQAVIRRIEAMRNEKASYREIAGRLNAEGFRTRRGSPWRLQYVAEIVTRLLDNPATRQERPEAPQVAGI